MPSNYCLVSALSMPAVLDPCCCPHSWFTLALHVFDRCLVVDLEVHYLWYHQLSFVSVLYILLQATTAGFLVLATTQQFMVLSCHACFF